MANFNVQDLFSALSGVSSGGTNNPYTPASSSNSPMNGPNMAGGSNSTTGGMGNQGNWQGNMTQPSQMGQMGSGQGIMGMFKDIAGRAPAIYQAMQRGPMANPMMSMMNGMNTGMGMYRR